MSETFPFPFAMFRKLRKGVAAEQVRNRSVNSLRYPLRGLPRSAINRFAQRPITGRGGYIAKSGILHCWRSYQRVKARESNDSAMCAVTVYARVRGVVYATGLLRLLRGDGGAVEFGVDAEGVHQPMACAIP